MKDCSFTEEEVISLTWGIYSSVLLFLHFVQQPSWLFPDTRKCLSACDPWKMWFLKKKKQKKQTLPELKHVAVLKL